jgi:putative hemolysin
MKILSLLSLLIGMISTQSWAGPSVTAGTGGGPMFICEEQNVTTYNVTDDEYKWALCVFDGVIERVTLSAYKSGEPQLAVKAYFSKKKRPALSNPNPATAFCKALKGTMYVTKGANGELHLCEFSDESTIEEWTLYYGAASEKNKNLTENLSQKTE